MEDLKKTISDNLGGMLHYLESTKPQPGASEEEFLYHQVMSNLIEDTYLRLDRMLTPRIGDRSAHNVPDTQILRISRRQLKEIIAGVSNYGTSDATIILADDGFSFQALLKNGTGDCRQIYNSESIQ